MKLALSSYTVDSLRQSLRSLLPVPLGIMIPVRPHVLILHLVVALADSLLHTLQFIILAALYGAGILTLSLLDLLLSTGLS